jgi:flavodoxin
VSTAVVYYSASGNSRYVAKRLAKRLKAKLVEIEETDPIRGTFGIIKGGFRAITNRVPEIKGSPWSEIAPHDIVYLLTPIWASRGAPAMSAFIKAADFSGKEVYLATLQADPSGQGSDRVQESMRHRIEKKGGSVEQSYTLHTAPPGRFAGEEHLEEELAKIL